MPFYHLEVKRDIKNAALELICTEYDEKKSPPKCSENDIKEFDNNFVDHSKDTFSINVSSNKYMVWSSINGNVKRTDHIEDEFVLRRLFKYIAETGFLTLTVINRSHQPFGPLEHVLSDYLESPKCTLTSLSLGGIMAYSYFNDSNHQTVPFLRRGAEPFSLKNLLIIREAANGYNTPTVNDSRYSTKACLQDPFGTHSLLPVIRGLNGNTHLKTLEIDVVGLPEANREELLMEAVGTICDFISDSKNEGLTKFSIGRGEQEAPADTANNRNYVTVSDVAQRRIATQLSINSHQTKASEQKAKEQEEDKHAGSKRKLDQLSSSSQQTSSLGVFSNGLAGSSYRAPDGERPSNRPRYN